MVGRRDADAPRHGVVGTDGGEHIGKMTVRRQGVGYFRLQLLAVALLISFLMYNIFDILRLDPMIVCNGGAACSAASEFSFYAEEWSGDHKCAWHHGSEYFVASLASPTLQVKGTLDTTGSSVAFTPFAPVASFTLQLNVAPKPISAVSTSGASAVLYAQKDEKSSRVLLAKINASSSVVTTFFPQQPAKFLIVEVHGTVLFSLHNVALNCQGCDWLHIPLTSPDVPELRDRTTSTFGTFPASTPLTFTLANESSIAGIAISFAESVSSEMDPSSLTVFASNGSKIGDFKCSSREQVRPPNRQIFYLDGVVVDTAVRLVFFGGGGGQLSLAEVEVGRSCTKGLLAGTDIIVVAQDSRMPERSAAMLATTRRLGLQVELCPRWSDSKILAERADISKRLWPGAVHMTQGGTVMEWYGTRHSEVWRELRDNTTRSSPTRVDEAFLSRVASLVQHFDVYKMMWERDVRVGLVLEDDTIFVKHFPSLFAKVVAEAPDPDSWDIIFIGGCLNKHAEPYGGKQHRKDGLLWKIRQHRCANGYIVSRRFLRRMLFSDYPRYKLWINIDVLLEGLMLNTITGVYWTEPPIVFEGSKALFGSHKAQ